ncbi:MAG: hypothetical protein ABDH20_07990 [Thermus sp.]
MRKRTAEALEGLERLGRMISLEAMDLLVLPPKTVEEEEARLLGLLEMARLLHRELYTLRARIAATLEDNSASTLRRELL